MGTKDARVDAYIAKSADFAKPILKSVRATVHAACPEVVETIKWGFPHFTYNGMLCATAAFKAHCALVFWKGKLVVGDAPASKGGAMGQLGRITKLADLPSKPALTKLVKKAMKLNDEGIKAPRDKTKPKSPPKVPADLAAALKRNAKARAAFEKFPPSHKREYVEWITSAKRDETRARRLAQAIDQIAQGKSQSWKYER